MNLKELLQKVKESNVVLEFIPHYNGNIIISVSPKENPDRRECVEASIGGDKNFMIVESGIEYIIEKAKKHEP